MGQTNNPFGLSDDTMRLVELLHQSQLPKTMGDFDYVTDWHARFDAFVQHAGVAASNACMAFMIANKQNVVLTYKLHEDYHNGLVILVIKAIGPCSVAIKQTALRLDYNAFSLIYGADTVLKAKITETVRKVGEQVAEAEKQAAKQRP